MRICVSLSHKIPLKYIQHFDCNLRLNTFAKRCRCRWRVVKSILMLKDNWAAVMFYGRKCESNFRIRSIKTPKETRKQLSDNGRFRSSTSSVQRWVTSVSVVLVFLRVTNSKRKVVLGPVWAQCGGNWTSPLSPKYHTRTTAAPSSCPTASPETNCTCKSLSNCPSVRLFLRPSIHPSICYVLFAI